jgi:LPXTG-motif cell wall-anchored protein
MSKRTIGTALAATGLIAATALAVLTAGPASATGNGNGHEYGKCEEIKHYDLKDVTHEYGGSAELTRWGLRLKTPAQLSRVRWDRPIEGKNPFAFVKELSYKTYSHNDGVNGSAAPALRIGLSKHGKDPVTLVYEPYYNGSLDVDGPWQTWDPIDGGSAKWWWEEEPGNPQTLRTWSVYQDTYKYYKVEFVNVGMGNYNEGADATVNDLKFKIGRTCEKHEWKKPKYEPTPSPSVTTTSPSPSPTDTKTSDAPPAGNGGGGSLPVTGAGVAGLTVVGGLLLAAGVVFVVFTRRRRFEV